MREEQSKNILYSPIPSGICIARSGSIPGYSWFVADAPWEKEEADDQLSHFLAEAYAVFQKESYRLLDIDTPFTAQNEKVLRFIVKCLIETRKLFDEEKGE